MLDKNPKIYKFDISLDKSTLFEISIFNVLSVDDRNGVLSIVLNNGATLTRFNHNDYMEFVLYTNNPLDKNLIFSIDQNILIKKISEDKYKVSDVYIQSFDGKIDNFENCFMFNPNNDAMRFILSFYDYDVVPVSKIESLDYIDHNDILRAFSDGGIVFTGLYQIAGVSQIIW